MAEVPVVDSPNGRGYVFAGSLLDAQSPAPYFSEILGVDLHLYSQKALEIPLTPSFEHAALVLSGDCTIDGQSLQPRMLYYLGTRRDCAAFASREGARILLIGGPPFPETILMWWNFVARTPEEIAQARADREQRERFGDVIAYEGPRLSAPSLLRFARPDPVS